MWLDFCRVSNPQWHHVLFTLVLYYLIGRGVWLEIKLIRLKYARPADARHVRDVVRRRSRGLGRGERLRESVFGEREDRRRL